MTHYNFTKVLINQEDAYKYNAVTERVRDTA